jgi:hypothetical protein
MSRSHFLVAIVCWLALPAVANAQIESTERAALERLRELGAMVETRQLSAVVLVTIDASWTGSPGDLRLLHAIERPIDLELSRRSLPAAMLEHVSGTAQLSRIYFQYVSFEGAGLAALADLPSLTGLRVTDSRLMAGRSRSSSAYRVS